MSMSSGEFIDSWKSVVKPLLQALYPTWLDEQLEDWLRDYFYSEFNYADGRSWNILFNDISDVLDNYPAESGKTLELLCLGTYYIGIGIIYDMLPRALASHKLGRFVDGLTDDIVESSDLESSLKKVKYVEQFKNNKADFFEDDFEQQVI